MTTSEGPRGSGGLTTETHRTRATFGMTPGEMQSFGFKEQTMKKG